MGTRADFWVGHGPQAEWLGSVAWDGYMWAEDPTDPLMQCATEEEFRAAVEKELASDPVASRPAHGWPWPWPTSSLTDYAYVFDTGKVHAYQFGRPHEVDENALEKPERTDWRDMTDVMKWLWGSGLV